MLGDLACLFFSILVVWPFVYGLIGRPQRRSVQVPLNVVAELFSFTWTIGNWIRRFVAGIVERRHSQE